MTDDRTTTRPTRHGSAATTAAGPAGHARRRPAAGSGAAAASPNGSVRSGCSIPGGLLMTLIIVIPLLLAVYISLIDLDQYTLRRWLEAPFIGLQNYVEAFQSGLPHSIWISVSFAVIATVGDRPDRRGRRARHPEQVPRPGSGAVDLPDPVRAAVVRGRPRCGGPCCSRTASSTRCWPRSGIDGGLWLNGPTAYWTLILVRDLGGLAVHLPAGAGRAAVASTARCTRRPRSTARAGGPSCATSILPYLRGPVAAGVPAGHPHHINNFTLPFVLFGVPAPDDVDVLPMLIYVTSFQSLRFGLSAAMADRVADAHRHPAVRLPAGGPARRPRGRRPEMTATADSHRPPVAAGDGQAHGRPARRHRLLPGAAAGHRHRGPAARWSWSRSPTSCWPRSTPTSGWRRASSGRARSPCESYTQDLVHRRTWPPAWSTA